MTQQVVEVRGLKEFSRGLRQVDKQFSNAVRKINRRVSDLVAGRAKASAGPFGGVIKPQATNNSAKIGFGNNPPYGVGQLWGAKARFGWYAAARYGASTGTQFPKWVGNQWDPGETGGMPYHIGPAINASVDDIERIYLEGVEDATKEAFPD